MDPASSRQFPGPQPAAAIPQAIRGKTAHAGSIFAEIRPTRSSPQQAWCITSRWSLAIRSSAAPKLFLSPDVDHGLLWWVLVLRQILHLLKGGRFRKLDAGVRVSSPAPKPLRNQHRANCCVSRGYVLGVQARPTLNRTWTREGGWRESRKPKRDPPSCPVLGKLHSSGCPDSLYGGRDALRACNRLSSSTRYA